MRTTDGYSGYVFDDQEVLAITALSEELMLNGGYVDWSEGGYIHFYSPDYAFHKRNVDVTIAGSWISLVAKYTSVALEVRDPGLGMHFRLYECETLSQALLEIRARMGMDAPGFGSIRSGHNLRNRPWSLKIGTSSGQAERSGTADDLRLDRIQADSEWEFLESDDWEEDDWTDEDELEDVDLLSALEAVRASLDGDLEHSPPSGSHGGGPSHLWPAPQESLMRATFCLKDQFCWELEFRIEVDGWSAIVQGDATGVGWSRLDVACTDPVILAFKQCLEVQVKTGEGLYDLNCLLSSLKAGGCRTLVANRGVDDPQVEWERLEMIRNSVYWYFQQIHIYHGETLVDERYDVKDPLPTGAPESLGHKLNEMWNRSAYELLEYDLRGGNRVEFSVVVDVQLSPQTTVRADDDIDDLFRDLLRDSPADRFSDDYAGNYASLKTLAEIVASRPDVGSIRGAPVRWPLMLEITGPYEEESWWDKMDHRARISAVAEILQHAQRLCKTVLMGTDMHVFVGECGPQELEEGSSGAGPVKGRGLSLDPFVGDADDRDNGRWWRYDEAFHEYLDRCSTADVEDPHDFFLGENIVVGIRQPLPFISRVLCRELSLAWSESVEELNHGYGAVGHLVLVEAGLNALRVQECQDGEIEEEGGLFLQFTESGIAWRTAPTFSGHFITRPLAYLEPLLSDKPSIRGEVRKRAILSLARATEEASPNDP